MNYQQYVITVKHDNGIFTLQVGAVCIAAAREQVKELEQCPDRAIISIKALSND